MNKTTSLLIAACLFGYFTTALAENHSQENEYGNKYNQLRCTVTPCPDLTDY